MPDLTLNAGAHVSIPALTVWQPWASLILAGAKPIEWRAWRPPAFAIGARIAIHAGPRAVRKTEIAELLVTLDGGGEALTSLNPAIALPLLERWHTSPGMLPLSSVLCTAVLGDPVSAADYAARHGFVGDSDRIDHTRWGWPLTLIEPVIPMAPARGAQGLWRWNGNV